jgi:hypothetical protein
MINSCLICSSDSYGLSPNYTALQLHNHHRGNFNSGMNIVLIWRCRSLCCTRCKLKSGSVCSNCHLSAPRQSVSLRDVCDWSRSKCNRRTLLNKHLSRWVSCGVCCDAAGTWLWHFSLRPSSTWYRISQRPVPASDLRFKFKTVPLISFSLYRNCLRHYATSRKVAGTIPDEVIGYSNWPNPSSH